MNPFWPLALPWQPPELQPSLVKIGTIWFGKLIGRFSSACLTVTGTVTDLSPNLAMTWRAAIGKRQDAAAWQHTGGLAVGDGILDVAAQVLQPAILQGGGHDQLGGVVHAVDRQAVVG